MRTLLLLVGSGVLLLVGFAVARTVTYGSAPPVLVPAADIAVSSGAAGRLAGSLRIPTISHEEPAAFDAGAFRALHTYLQMAFPRAHAELQRETVAAHSLLYAWLGTDPSLKPILLAGHLDVVRVEPGMEKNWQEDRSAWHRLITSEVIAATHRERHPRSCKESAMAARRALLVNASFTSASAIVLIALREELYPLFALGSSTVLIVIGVVLLLYAGALVIEARRDPPNRRAVLTAALLDAGWVVGSAILLVAAWSTLAAAGRVLIIAAALVVEAFAFLQYRVSRTMTVETGR